MEAMWLRVGLVTDGEAPMEEIAKTWADAASNNPEIMVMWIDTIEDMSNKEAGEHLKDILPDNIH